MWDLYYGTKRKKFVHSADRIVEKNGISRYAWRSQLIGIYREPEEFENPDLIRAEIARVGNCVVFVWNWVGMPHLVAVKYNKTPVDFLEE